MPWNILYSMEDTMLRKVILSAVLVALSISLASNVGASEKPATAYPSSAVLKQIVIWLWTNFDLPRIFIYPNIEFVSRDEIDAMRYKGFAWVAPLDVVITTQGEPLHPREVSALYDDEMKTIYLPKQWTGATAAEQSVLVHEMVHHLQGLGKLEYDCPSAREQLAYAAQEKWLGRSGLNLANEFEIDPFTLAVSTRCIY
jgi:hypothetical protein